MCDSVWHRFYVTAHWTSSLFIPFHLQGANYYLSYTHTRRHAHNEDKHLGGFQHSDRRSQRDKHLGIYPSLILKDDVLHWVSSMLSLRQQFHHPVWIYKIKQKKNQQKTIICTVDSFFCLIKELARGWANSGRLFWESKTRTSNC